MRDDGPDRSLPVLITLVVFALILMTIDIRTQGVGVGETLRSGAQTLIVPAQKVADRIVDPVVELVRNIAEVGEVRERNRILEQELEASETRLAEVEAELARLDALEDLFRLTTDELEHPVAVANVVGRPDANDPSFLIDRGTSSGVVAGQPVVDQNGNVVGRVTVAAPLSALVVPITGDRAGLTVVVDGQVGTAVPRAASDLLELTIFSTSEGVEEGARVITSSQSTQYPAGLAVGVVEEGAEPLSSTVEATIRPYADPDLLSVVAVLAWPRDPITDVEVPQATTTTTGDTSASTTTTTTP
ncbi:MAG: hypothetical protein GEU79_15545 [Acidimicrobiia bacterium]|nr:hypothetical protein [Acidimicrobiia bacterium]